MTMKSSKNHQTTARLRVVGNSVCIIPIYKFKLLSHFYAENTGTIISGNSELKRTTTNDVVSSSLYTRGQICSMSSNTIQAASTDPLAHSGMDNFVAMNVEISQKLSIARMHEETDAIVLFGHIKEWSRLYSKCPENIKNFDCAKVLGFVKRYEENARFLDTANAEIDIADAEIHQNVIQAIIAECKSHLPIPLRC